MAMKLIFGILFLLCSSVGVYAQKGQFKKVKSAKEVADENWKIRKWSKGSIQLYLLPDSSKYHFIHVYPSTKPKVVEFEHSYRKNGNRIVLMSFVKNQKQYFEGKKARTGKLVLWVKSENELRIGGWFRRLFSPRAFVSSDIVHPN